MLLLGLALPSSAWAQSPGQGDDRFFAEKDEDPDADDDDTLVQGSLTSTNFAYRETGGIAQPLDGGMEGVENAAPFSRLFTDLRGRLTARHVKGSSYDFHGDARLRYTPDQTATDDTDLDVQSGTFGGNEYEVRELYVKKYGVSTDVTVGRQYVLELAATKIDGVRIDYAKEDRWKYIGFVGAYPSRISRSIEEDYPQQAPAMMGGEPGSRIIPVAAGAGAAYRYEKYYGSFGLVGVLPRGEERLEGAPRAERPRIFATANGYYRRSAKLDVYHFAVVDLYGSNVSDRDELSGTLSDLPLTNLSLGVNYKPTPALRVYAQLNRVDTETLNVIAQTRLEDPDPNANTVVQNNIDVLRISQQSARLGVSGAFKQNRFEISASGLVRQRPEITLTRLDDTTVTIPGAKALEVTLSAVDRKSIKKHRVTASFTSINGFGEENLYRTDANVARVGASREFKEGKGEYELDLSYVFSTDENRDEAMACVSPFETCFGTSKVNTLSVGGLVFYRVKPDWFVVGGASAASQGITIVDTTAAPPTEESQPRILILTAHLRIAYRF